MMNIKILEKFEVLNSEILANLVELVIRETIYLLRRLKGDKYEEYTENNNNNADIYYINYYSRNVF
ncbi:hypothetical protein ANG5_0614 [Streptococcus constellatus subsp. pharyngis SK1060 = CCUG 46377]|uniref:Uncharacterized protein n=1 Tax=Streptococcus constellatus subsp. pharyngis SK1060 = CCUG 46377 TaxID=1035184 RepID=U2XW60_STRCV|nr:hypothetical protein ANG5_0614 [Streptococcus constellatus subsp. pharyngis SK1060 = CCUG 46377]